MIRWLMTLGRIALYVCALVILLLMVYVVAPGLVCVGFVICIVTFMSLIGCLQALAVWYFWPREATRPQTWAQMYRYPQRTERGKEAE